MSATALRAIWGNMTREDFAAMLRKEIDEKTIR